MSTDFSPHKNGSIFFAFAIVFFEDWDEVIDEDVLPHVALEDLETVDSFLVVRGIFKYFL